MTATQAVACPAADGEQAEATPPDRAFHTIGLAKRVRSEEFRSIIRDHVTGTVESERDGISDIRLVSGAFMPVTISTFARPAIPITGV